jgi:tripartite-type tricarboxylate transporter receptor subunit TctC
MIYQDALLRLSRLSVLIAMPLAAGTVMLPTPVAAQAFPNRAITVIVPYGPGTGIDLAGRIITQKLIEEYGQPIVIRNMPGASGNIGADAIAAAAPDGYTIGMIPNSAFINQFVQKNARDPLKDFVPISPAGTQPYLLAVPPSFPAKSISEVVALAKAKPGELNFTGLSGSVPHFLGVMLRSAGGIDIRMISYKSTTDAVNDVINGRVQLWFTPLPSGMSFIKSGRVYPLAVTGTTRSPLAPNVPTMTESGFPGMDMNSALYFVAPRATPAAIVAKLNADIGRVASSKEIYDKLLAQGLTFERRNSAEFAEDLRAEQAKWSGIVKASGLKPE